MSVPHQLALLRGDVNFLRTFETLRTNFRRPVLLERFGFLSGLSAWGHEIPYWWNRGCNRRRRNRRSLASRVSESKWEEERIELRTLFRFSSLGEMTVKSDRWEGVGVERPILGELCAVCFPSLAERTRFASHWGCTKDWNPPGAWMTDWGWSSVAGLKSLPSLSLVASYTI